MAKKDNPIKAKTQVKKAPVKKKEPVKKAHVKKKEPWTDSVAKYQTKLLKSSKIPIADEPNGLETAMMGYRSSLPYGGPGDGGWWNGIVRQAIFDGTFLKLGFQDILKTLKDYDGKEFEFSLSETTKIFWKSIKDGALMDITLNDIKVILNSSKDIFPIGYYRRSLRQRAVKFVKSKTDEVSARTSRFAGGLHTVILLGGKPKKKVICGDCKSHDCSDVDLDNL